MTDQNEQPTGEWFDAMDHWPKHVRATAVLIAAAFAAVVWSAPILWLSVRPAVTHASVPAPQWTWSGFESGASMRTLERHLKESSWVTWWLRGCLNENLLRVGLLDSKFVAFGPDGWLFYADSLLWLPERLEVSAKQRRQIFLDAKAALAAAGAELLVLPVPDRISLYPEHLPAYMNPARAGLYDVMLADLKATGVHHLDLRSILKRRKEQSPDVELYPKSDTHWLLAAKHEAALQVAKEVDARGWRDRVTPPASVNLLPARQGLAMGGVAGQLGLRVERSIPLDEASAVVQNLRHVYWHQAAVVGAVDGPHQPYAVQYDDAGVALCGTSFSEGLGAQISAALGTTVDHRGAIWAGGPFRGIRKVLAEIGTNGFRPRLVLWEINERQYLQDWCTEQKLLP